MGSPEIKTTVNHINPGTVRHIAHVITSHFADDSNEMYSMMRFLIMDRQGAGGDTKSQMLACVRTLAFQAGMQEEELAGLNEMNALEVVKMVELIKQGKEAGETRGRLRKAISSVPPVISRVFKKK